MIGDFYKYASYSFVFLCIASICSDARGQAEDPYFDIDSSAEKKSLNGEWDFRLDLRDEGEGEQWQSDTGSEGWQKVEVPSTYNALFRDYKRFKGKAWYRRSLDLKAPGENERLIIRFLGVAIRCKVWLNGNLVGEHQFPYTPFELDLTEHYRGGRENRLVVMTDNSILERAIPDTEWDGWWYYGGIYRDVYIERRPSSAITNLWLEPERLGNGWYFIASSTVRHYGSQATDDKLTMSLLDRNGSVIWSVVGPVSPKDQIVRFRGFLEKVEPWSPEFPVLYTLTAKLESNTTYTRTIRTGFREIEVRGSRIFLNGEPLQIRGISRHEEFAGVGSAVPRNRTKKDVEEIQQLGANLLRTAHYTQDPYLYELCDEMGLLIWTEIPAWKTSVKVLGDRDIFDQWAAPQLAEMIDSYRRHPSVVIWSLGNEFDSTLPRAAWYVEWGTDFVKRRDGTRLVTYASDKHRTDQRPDICFPFVDVIAINEYYGWYYGEMNDVGERLDALHARFPGKPIVVSEYGSGTPLKARAEGKLPTSGQHFNTDYQIEYLKTHMQQIYEPSREDYVAGGMIWLYNDFNDPHREGDDHPSDFRFVNLKGLVTRDRKRKPSFDAVMERYHALKKKPD